MRIYLGNFEPRLETVLSVLFPLLDLEGFRIEQVHVQNHQWVLVLARTRRLGRCPLCKHRSKRVHSFYHRTLADLPLRGAPVRLQVRVRRFFCDRRRCRRKIFAERLEGLAAPYARRTQSLSTSQQQVGLALGGNAGARLTPWIGMQTSASTLLRLVHRLVPPSDAKPRVVGVDDWAFRKGHRYGTILVDLERHCLLDLLPDRSSESLAAWLKQHPEIEILSRDRAGVYAEGSRQGSPQAQQVVDRWHLLRNLGEAMERLTAQHGPDLRQAAHHTLSPEPELPAVAIEAAHVPRVEQQRLERCQQRQACYQQIHQLRQQGLSVPAIVAEVGVSKRTVQRFLQAQQFPERSRRRRQPRNTDRYAEYLRQRLTDGCHNVAQLYREIKEQGYRGSYASLFKVVQALALTPLLGQEGAPQSRRSPARPAVEVPSSRRVAWWLHGHFCRSHPAVAEQQKAFVADLYTLAPILKEAAELAQGFILLVKNRSVQDLEAWLKQAIESSCPEVRLFAKGLSQDLAAVQNAVTMEWSNGQTEGQVNRLKMLKRQMYGRASFGLLRKRVLLA